MSGIALTNNNGGITPVNPDIEFIQGNDGMNVPPNPTTHIILLLGDNTQGVDTSGDPGSYTETITMFDATESQKGVVLLATNAETIAGSVTTKATTPDDIKAKLGAQTLNGIPYGNTQTGALNWLANATDGQIPIGSTGSAPVLANITSLDGSIGITNGPGTIDLSAYAFTSTVTSTNLVPANLVSFPLGSTLGTYQFKLEIVAYDTTNILSAGYSISNLTIRKTGTSTAAIVGDPSIDTSEEGALVDVDVVISISGNDLNVEVTGINPSVINWKCSLTYIFVS